MRSPVAELARAATRLTAPRRPVDNAPVPYSPRRVPGLPWYTQRSTEGQLRAMGSVGTLFAIVDRLATSTAAEDWRLYRQPRPGQDPDEREEVTSHLALDIWRKPNDFFTRALFVETVQQHFELVGEEWWVIARNPAMRSIPLELWPVRPDGKWIEPRPRLIVCDHDAEGRAVLERELGMGTTAARKNVTEGIQAVQARLRPAGDGRPRLFILRDSLVFRDPELEDAKKPTCTAEEIVGYVWAVKPGASGDLKEEPLKQGDHGMDGKRYMVAERDLGAPARVRFI